MSTESIKRAIFGVSLFATLFCVLMIFVLTHMPLDTVSDQTWFRYSTTFWIDKFVQCSMYAVLVALLGCTLFPLNKDATNTIDNISSWRTGLLFVIVIAIAVTDELTQPMFGRNCEMLDIAADIAGLIPGFCLFLVLNELRHQLLNGEW